MNGASWASALLLAVVASNPSHSQTLTEERFIDEALKNHPGMAAAEAEVAAASGSRIRAATLDNPEIAWDREDPDIGPRQDTFRVSWRLPFDGRRHRVAAADSALEASKAELAAVRLMTSLEMRSLFASWYITTEREAILRENLERTKRLAAWLTARAEEGEVAGVEALRLNLELEVLEREAAAASAAAKGRRSAVAVWSGLVTGNAEPARPQLPSPPSMADVGDRPDLKALAHRAAAAQSQHQLSRRVLKTPTVSAGWLEIRDSSRSFGGPVFGVTWPLPIFDRNQGARRTAAAKAEKARLEVEATRRRATQDADAALAVYSDLFEMAAHGGTTTSEAEIVGAVIAAFEDGEASLTDVLDTMRGASGVQIARLETLARTLAAKNELEAALGRLLTPGENS